jgi:hypothetical protein
LVFTLLFFLFSQFHFCFLHFHSSFSHRSFSVFYTSILFYFHNSMSVFSFFILLSLTYTFSGFYTSILLSFSIPFLFCFLQLPFLSTLLSFLFPPPSFPFHLKILSNSNHHSPLLSHFYIPLIAFPFPFYLFLFSGVVPCVQIISSPEFCI